MWYLYVLVCENGMYYVGMTLYPKSRITAHFQGEGANFTKRNKPLGILELECLNTKDRKQAYKLETWKTKECRKNFGSHCVVGGKHIHLPRKTKYNLETPKNK
jgi:predicted GIY-YIG superfamily endonuclease